MSEGLTLYPERVQPESEEIKRAVEIFSKPPEFVLNTEQKAEVLAFELNVTNGLVPEGFAPEVTELPEENAQERIAKSVVGKKICVDYLLTEEGQKALEDLLQKPVDIDRNNVRSFIASELSQIATKDFRQFSAKSQGFAKSRLVEAVVADEPTDLDYFSTIKNPKTLVDKVRAGRSLKAYYKSLETQLAHEPDSNTKDAKMVILKLQRERVNTMLGSMYRRGISFYGEIKSGAADVSKQSMYNELKKYLPALPSLDSELSIPERKLRNARIVNRIDKFVNGVDRTNDYSPISRSLDSLPDSVAEVRSPQGIDTKDHIFSDISEEKLEHFTIDAQMLKLLFEQALESIDLLEVSSDIIEHASEANEETSQLDKKWHVEIRENIDSLAIQGKAKIIKIPANFHRTLNQVFPAGALAVLDHEMVHVIQHENGQRLKLEFIIRGRSARGNLWFESGGILSEIASQEKLFGQERSINFGYLFALKKRLQGGKMSECTKAFYDQYHQEFPNISEDTALATAADRTLRLFKDGGEWTVDTEYWSNSAPLEYAEQKILIDAIPPELHYLFYVGRVNFQTLAELYRIGWLNKSDFLIPQTLPSESVVDTVKDWLKA